MAPPFQVSLTLDHPLTQSMRHTFFMGSPAKLAPRIAEETVGFCYFNVLDHIDKNGGEIAFGWTITMWPHRYVEALHHAVWRNTDGELFDVTAPAFPAAIEPAPFILDEKQNYDLTFDLGVASKFIQLDTLFETANFISITKEAMDATALVVSFIKANGGVGKRIGREIQVSFADENNFEKLDPFLTNAKRLRDAKPAIIANMLKNEPRYKRGKRLCSCGSGLAYQHCHYLFQL